MTSMTEQAYRQALQARGYGEPQVRKFEPNLDGELHTHDFSAFVMVTEGEFTVAYEDRSERFGPGEACEVVAGTLHAEQSGADGATALIAKK